MTGQQIYVLASSFLYERDGEDADSKHFAVGFINILLQEALPCENSNRKSDGQELLRLAPTITSLDEEIPYHEEILRVAFPYGLASWYFAEAMDNYHESFYRNKFLAALEDATKTNEGIVEGW